MVSSLFDPRLNITCENDFGQELLLRKRESWQGLAQVMIDSFFRLEHYKPVIEKRTFGLKTCINSRRDASGVVNLGEAIQQWSYDVMVGI